MKDGILNKISPNEALAILKQITKTDTKLKEKVIELAEGLLSDVEVERVCDEVFAALEWLDVHDLWDGAGEHIDGYISPDEMAADMFDGALEPFLKELNRLFDLEMQQEAKLHCMGLLKGLYRYEEESESEFKDWAGDLPRETFEEVLDKWKKRNSDNKDRKEMKDFIKDECQNWSEWASKRLFDTNISIS